MRYIVWKGKNSNTIKTDQWRMACLLNALWSFPALQLGADLTLPLPYSTVAVRFLGLTAKVAREVCPLPGLIALMKTLDPYLLWANLRKGLRSPFQASGIALNSCCSLKFRNKY